MDIHIGAGFIKIVLATVLLFALVVTYSKLKETKYANWLMALLGLILWAGSLAIIDGVWRLL